MHAKTTATMCLQNQPFRFGGWTNEYRTSPHHCVGASIRATQIALHLLAALLLGFLAVQSQANESVTPPPSAQPTVTLEQAIRPVLATFLGTFRDACPAERQPGWDDTFVFSRPQGEVSVKLCRYEGVDDLASDLSVAKFPNLFVEFRNHCPEGWKEWDTLVSEGEVADTREIVKQVISLCERHVQEHGDLELSRDDAQRLVGFFREECPTFWPPLSNSIFQISRDGGTNRWLHACQFQANRQAPQPELVKGTSYRVAHT